MKCIVVIDLEATRWEVLDITFSSCPESPVRYRATSLYTPVEILEKCNKVKIINVVTGAEGTGTPIKIN